MNWSTLITICILSCIPIKVMAIEISEVAWMGSADSANHEWIELHAPTTIDVTGWTLSDDNNLQIELTGTISAGEYAVLERTSDDSAPGSLADIYRIAGQYRRHPYPARRVWWGSRPGCRWR